MTRHWLRLAVLANTPMLELFEHSGFPITSRREPGVVHVTLSLR